MYKPVLALCTEIGSRPYLACLMYTPCYIIIQIMAFSYIMIKMKNNEYAYHPNLKKFSLSHKMHGYLQSYISYFHVYL